MLASIPLCLVGWCWSVGWGISLLNIASNQAMKWKCLTRMDCLYLSCSDCFNSVHRQAACLWGKGADKITTRAPRGIFATRWNEAQNGKAWHHVAWVEELVLDLIFTPTKVKVEPGLEKPVELEVIWKKILHNQSDIPCICPAHTTTQTPSPN